jgi:hypothetical protein
MHRLHPQRCEREQERRADGESRVAGENDLLSLEPVRGVSADQEEDYSRKELRQPNQTEIERPLGDVVNLPAHGHRLHLRGRHRQESPELVVAKACVPECSFGGL